jgi:hypothetical protein
MKTSERRARAKGLVYLHKQAMNAGKLLIPSQSDSVSIVEVGVGGQKKLAKLAATWCCIASTYTVAF